MSHDEGADPSPAGAGEPMPAGQPGWAAGIAPVACTRTQAAVVYDRLAPWYDLAVAPFEAGARATGRRLLGLRPGERLLEVGCGTGHDAVAYAESAGPEGAVVAVDVSARMLAATRRRSELRGVTVGPHLARADAVRLPFAAGSFDAVAMAFTLELLDLEDLGATLGEARRVLRPGGRLAAVVLDLVDRPPPAATAYLRARRWLPRLLACRPVPVARLLRRAAFEVVASRPVGLWGIPAVAVLATPAHVDAWLFDLDGVLTDTADAHVRAWAATFDAFLDERSKRTGEPFRAFDPVTDYERYVDGKRRSDGVRDFLASRGISLPEGGPDDPPDAQTVRGVGSRKNAALLASLARDGVRPFGDALALLDAVHEGGGAAAVVSGSENCTAVLGAAGLEGRFLVQVDGRVARQEHLAGKPAPDTYLRAADLLGVEPRHAAVVEDAPAGVAAGAAGKFGLVVGVARRAAAAELYRAGADVVVTDLSELAGMARERRQRHGEAPA